MLVDTVKPAMHVTCNSTMLLARRAYQYQGVHTQRYRNWIVRMDKLNFCLFVVCLFCLFVCCFLFCLFVYLFFLERDCPEAINKLVYAGIYYLVHVDMLQLQCIRILMRGIIEYRIGSSVAIWSILSLYLIAIGDLVSHETYR